MRIEEPAYFEQTLRVKTLVPSAGCVLDAHVGAAAAIQATKVVHEHTFTYKQDDGSDVAAATVPIGIMRAAGTIKAVEAVCIDAPEGGDKGFEVDVQKAANGVAAATVLTGTIDWDSGIQSDYEVQDGTVASAGAIAADYTLVVVITVSGSTGNQGQGLQVTVRVRETPT